MTLSSAPAEPIRCAVCDREARVTDTIERLVPHPDPDSRYPGWVCGLRCRLEQIHGKKLHDEGAGL